MRIEDFACPVVVFAFLGFAPLAEAQAEPMYVEDELILNVYEEPDQVSARVATLKTGDTVEALDRVDDFFLVRLADGVEGWVGANYLTTQAPAIIRLRELESQQKSATQKAQKVQKELDEQVSQLKAENDRLQTQVAQLEEQAAAALQTVAEPAPPPVPQAEPRRSEHMGIMAWVWVPLVIIAGGLGYLLGHQLLARRIRAKFGGVKIY